MNKTKKYILTAFIVALLAFALSGCAGDQVANKDEIRVGYFPNITHSQAIVGLANGTFQKELGDEIKIRTKLFNAGPSAIEALFADEIDICYIGPNPAINGYSKSKGEALRIVAGATSGGASLVVNNKANIRKASDLNDKTIATPQLGNTQDIALKAFLIENGLKTKENGGTIRIVNAENSDILTLFIKGELDAAWVPEPWVSRLTKEAGGTIFKDERELWPRGEFVTANVIVRKDFLKERHDLVKKWLRGHVKTTIWINSNKEQAKAIINKQLKQIIGKELDAEVLDNAFSRLDVTWDPVKSSLLKSANSAFELKLIKDKDIKNIHDLEILNEVLKENNRKEIR